MERETQKGSTQAGEKEGTAQEIYYIPNPLPLPKKHAKKEIGFDFEPDPELLEFDVELKEGEDDFDI